MNEKMAKICRKVSGFKPGQACEYLQGVMRNTARWTSDEDAPMVAALTGVLLLTREGAIAAGIPPEGDHTHCFAARGPVINKTKSEYKRTKREAEDARGIIRSMSEGVKW
jgi:hypothetical protein